jgi:hypothetical protein
MDVQKRKTIVIPSLTVLALLISGLEVSIRWFPKTVVALVVLVAFPGVLACSIGVFRAMCGWSVHWFVKVVVILFLGLALITTAFLYGAIIFPV